MTTGDQLVPAFGFAATQEPAVTLAASKSQPHIGTACPSGSTACVGAAVTPTVVCAYDAVAATRRTVAASPDRIRLALKWMALIAVLPITISIRRFCKHAGLRASSSTCRPGR